MFPSGFLVSKPTTAGWHNFGMEWKEHVAWLAPILATTVAYMVTKYGARLAKDDAGSPRHNRTLHHWLSSTAAVAGPFRRLYQ